MKELTKIQHRAAIWILDAFKTTPTGAAESLAGLILIDLQIQKLIYRNHVHMHMLADSHITHMVSAGENQAHKKAKSPLIDMWANKNLVSINVIPFNEFNTPGLHLYDRFQDHISFDIVLISSKNAKEQAKAKEKHLMSLNKAFNTSSNLDTHVAIVADASVPLLHTGHQAVAAWSVWHTGQYTKDWRSNRLSMSDDMETAAIAGAFGTLADTVDSIFDMEEIHIFLDSTNAIKHLLGPSIHSAQCYVLEILSILTPWMEENDKLRIICHHVPNCEDYMFEPH